MRKWIIGLLGGVLLAVSGCTSMENLFSSNTYRPHVYDPSGRELHTNISWVTDGDGVQTARKGICRAYPGAKIVFAEMMSDSTRTYKCAGKWQESAAIVSANMEEDSFWQKPGTDAATVRKALKKCGAPEDLARVEAMEDNEYAPMARCMMKAGFKNVNGETAFLQCKDSLPRSGFTAMTVVPKPGIKRRMAGAWCQAHKNESAK